VCVCVCVCGAYDNVSHLQRLGTLPFQVTGDLVERYNKLSKTVPARVNEVFAVQNNQNTQQRPPVKVRLCTAVPPRVRAPFECPSLTPP
jgi:hypothetical protein